MKGLNEKIGKTIEESQFDALIAVGPDNIQYMSGVVAPFIYTRSENPIAIIWSKKDEPTFIVPREWVQTLRNSSRIQRIVSYNGEPQSFIKKIVEIVHSDKLIKNIGVDTLRLSATLYDDLKNELKDYTITSCDELLRNLRSIKTVSELTLLEKVAYNVDHGIFGEAHHVLVRNARTEMAYSEGVRVHCIERNLDLIGGHSTSLVVSGEHAKKYWPLAPFYGIGKGKQVVAGEYVRFEAKYSINGYWSDATRLLTMGEPTKEQKEAYDILVALRNKAVETIKPNKKCSEIYEAIMAEAVKMEAKIVEGTSFGHSIGVSVSESPYITALDHTELKPGMVIVLEPQILGPNDEILFSKDTVIVTKEGCRITGWYKNWNDLYDAVVTF